MNELIQLHMLSSNLLSDSSLVKVLLGAAVFLLVEVLPAAGRGGVAAELAPGVDPGVDGEPAAKFAALSGGVFVVAAELLEPDRHTGTRHFFPITGEVSADAAALK